MRSKRSMLVASLASAAVPLPALAQRLGTAAEPDISWSRILAALLLCIAAAAGLSLIIAKRGRLNGFAGLGGLTAGVRKARRLRLVEAMRISPHVDICLVTCDDREFLLACAQGEVRVLSEGSTSRDEAAPSNSLI